MRKNLLAKIHIGKKALGWRDDDYRAILQGRYGQNSAGDLSDAQLDDLCRHLQSQGVKFKGHKPARPGRQSATDSYYPIPKDTPYVQQKRYIAGLWNMLGYKMTGLDTRAKKQFRVDKFIWLNDQDNLQTLAKDLWNRCKKRGLDPDPDAY